MNFVVLYNLYTALSFVRIQYRCTSTKHKSSVMDAIREIYALLLNT